MKTLLKMGLPKVALYADFLTESECAELVSLAGDRLEKSTVVADEGNAQHESRTSSGMFFKRKEFPVVAEIERRLSQLVGVPEEYGEGLQVLRYEVGQEYRPHQDYFDKPGEYGQRTTTVLLYLNTPEEGGGTVFPDADLHVEATQGNALVFEYPVADGSSKTLHGGAPVTKGVKWAATKWYRDRPQDGSKPRQSMHLNVINLAHRTDRWAHMGQAFAGLPLVRFDALKHEKGGWVGCLSSHAALLKDLVQRDGSGMYTVLEDDCTLLNTPEIFRKRWAKYQDYLAAHQGEWDYFMGGGTYLLPLRVVNRDPCIVECDWGVCTQFIVHSDRSAKTLIDYGAQAEWDTSCDNHLSRSHRGKIWVAYPMLAWQLDDVSDIASSEQKDVARRAFVESVEALDKFVKENW